MRSAAGSPAKNGADDRKLRPTHLLARGSMSVTDERMRGLFAYRFRSVIGKGGIRMGKMPLIVAVASAMWALPASAGDGGNTIPSKPEVTLAQLDVCVGPDCRERDRVHRERRYFNRYDDDRRYGRGGACRDVTIRERRGGEVVFKHVRRCD